MVVYRCLQITTTTLTTKDNIPSILPNEVIHGCLSLSSNNHDNIDNKIILL